MSTFSRRDLLAALGGVPILATLTGCATGHDPTPAPEPTRRLSDPLLASSDPPIRELRFAITTDSAQTSALCAPTNGIVTGVQLDIVTPYSAAATIRVGISGALSQFMEASDSYPQNAGLYVVDQDAPLAAAASVLVTISGSPSAGAGFCIVQYAISG